MTHKDTPSDSSGSAGDSLDPHEAPGANGSFPIVGVGASAGGLEAFSELLKHLPGDTGMAFVLVQHLDPQHDSALTQILSRATALPVREITSDQRVEPNYVYIITPNTSLSIAEGVLKIQPRPQTRLPHRSIDTFFDALARDQRERAIGVVLSGTASDGTQGLEAIKAEDGITFAQNDSARYDSMPRSAVAAGCVDFILAPEQIAQELARLAAHPYLAGEPSGFLTPPDDDQRPLAPAEGEAPRPSMQRARAGLERGRQAMGTEDGYKKILRLMRNHSGVDFSLYKSNTLQRRIARRLVLSKETTLESYARSLRGNAKELDALYSDLLISVTGFFRNPEAFDALQHKVLPALFKQGHDPLRAWVLGCSTGQEAYSLAMALVEAADEAPTAPQLQIFATDLNDALLEKARYGLYAKSLVENITPARLRRFFVEEEGGYRVSKTLRDMILFARQNLITDPPFPRLNLISCRNLLIYLEPSVQKKALPTLHYALKPEGYLFLGASESISGFTELFEPVDRKYKLYAKKTAPTPALHLPLRKEHDERHLPHMPGAPGEPAEGWRGELNAQREADRIILNRFAPPGVLINDELQILQFRGPTDRYLELPSGKASFDVLKMARNGLLLPLRAAINQAKQANQTALKDNVRIKYDDQRRAVNVEVIPLKNLRERCFLILFEDADAAGAAHPSDRQPAPAAPSPRDEAAQRIAELETELAETRDYLQSMQEQYEAANEELQSANEETESANEELQSLNEELETSKEELESSNEELTTVNEEMTNRNAELDRLNNDLLNLQSSTRLPIVLLGRDLTIRRFSPQAEKQFELQSTDVGRPIGHIRHNLILDPEARENSPPALEPLADDVITDVREAAHEVQDQTGRWYSLHMHPYITRDNKVDGAVLVLVDINTLKRSQQASAEARDYAENLFATVPEPLLVLDTRLRVEHANQAFYRTFEVEPAETLGRLIFDLDNGQWNIPRLRELLKQTLPRNRVVEDFEIGRDLEPLGSRIMLLNAVRHRDSASQSERILLTVTDITERKRMERKITEQAQELADQNRRKDEFLAILSHELRNPLAPMLNALQLISQDEDESARQREVHGLIERQVRHLARLVDDLLDVSRITSGRIRLRIERVDANGAIERAVERVRHMIDHRGQQLSISAAAEPVWLDADPARLEQVVGNLLNNASKYTDEGGHIALSVEQGSGEASVRVRDDGQGMTADTLARVFGFFSQADQSLDYSQGGLGIGLALVKSLVELHGGSVEAHSEGLGQGSELVVRLPLAAAPEKPTDSGEPASHGEAYVRVLVADDNLDATQMSAMLLRSWGHEVRVARDGADALQAAAEFRPQVILLDIGLPDMDGYEVARRMRQNPQLQDARLVAVTGYSQDNDRQRSTEAGFDDHLVKPVEPSDLKALLGGG